jgi:nucleoside-diphosphate-sugar epimerase
MRPEKSEVNRLIADNTKARELTGWEPGYTLDAGLSETIAWIKNNPGRFNPTQYTA